MDFSDPFWALFGAVFGLRRDCFGRTAARFWKFGLRDVFSNMFSEEIFEGISEGIFGAEEAFYPTRGKAKLIYCVAVEKQASFFAD